MIKPLTKAQATILTACTGVMMFTNGKLFKEEVEKKLGREVTLEEFATEDFREMVMQMYLPDFIKLAYRETGLIIVPE